MKQKYFLPWKFKLPEASFQGPIVQLRVIYSDVCMRVAKHQTSEICLSLSHVSCINKTFYNLHLCINILEQQQQHYSGLTFHCSQILTSAINIHQTQIINIHEEQIINKHEEQIMNHILCVVSHQLAGQLSWLERRANNANVVGSIPTLAIIFFC